MRTLPSLMVATVGLGMVLLLPFRAHPAQKSQLPPTLAKRLLFPLSLPLAVSDASSLFVNFC
jgi:hypothetical protein